MGSKMISHHTIKIMMIFVLAVVLVNLANYIFYVYYNPRAEDLWGAQRRPIAIDKLEADVELDYESDVISAPNLKDSKKGKLCPMVQSGLGPITANKTMFHFPVESISSVVTEGYNKLKSCVARERAAVFVPIPPTADYPFEFVNYIHSFLRQQMLEYQVFVVKQGFATPYNRGRLINAAFTLNLKKLIKSFSCIIIHEPTMLPVDTRNIYRCSWYPRQLVATLKKDNNVTSYESTFGGVIAIRRDQFVKVNGFSNTYDNNGVFLDLAKRLSANNYIIERTSPIIGNYISFKTTGTTEEIEIPPSQNSSQSNPSDGLNSVKYIVEKSVNRDTFIYQQIVLPDGKPHSTTLLVTSKLQESTASTDTKLSSLNVV